MAFAQLQKISVAYGDRDVLSSVSLTLDRNSRIALVGDNGSGKTTLLRIAAGIASPDSGDVHIQRGSVVSYLPQSGLVFEGRTLLEEADTAFERFHDIDKRKTEIEERLGRVDEMTSEVEGLLHEHDELQQTLIHSGFYDREPVVRRVLTGLGFEDSDLDRPTEEFSGGWQMRIGLAKVLLEDPAIVLLDEPTNYLDIEARAWLESFLADFPGGVMVVSHDRYFLDVTVRSVAELFRGNLTLYHGNFSAYQRRRTQELESLAEAYRQQQQEIERIESFIRKFRSKPTKAAQVQSRVKMLEKMERIEIPESMKRITFSFPEAPHSGKIVLRAEGISRRYGSHVVLEDLEFLLERGDRMVIAGKNGAGKSTLMRILAEVDTDYDGTLRLGSGVKIGYFSQDLDSLPESGTVLEAVEAVAATEDIPRLRDLLGAFLFRGDDVFKSVSVLSGGERSRLALLLLLLHPVNLLILDEPTNHLDMTSKRVLLDALSDFGGTLVFVSHDRYFIEALADRVLALRDRSWRIYPGDYEYFLWRSAEEESEQVEPGDANADSANRKTDQIAPPNPGETHTNPDEPGGASDDAAPERIHHASSPGLRKAGEPRSGNGDTSVPERNDEEKRKPLVIRIDRQEEKELKRRLRKLETTETETLEELEELDSAYDTCQVELAREENYTVGDRVRELTTQLDEIEKKRERTTDRWHEIETEVTAIRKRLEASGRAK